MQAHSPDHSTQHKIIYSICAVAMLIFTRLATLLFKTALKIDLRSLEFLDEACPQISYTVAYPSLAGQTLYPTATRGKSLVKRNREYVLNLTKLFLRVVG